MTPISKRTSVVHIVPWWGPGIGGVKRFVLSAFEALADDPFAMTVLSIGNVIGDRLGLRVDEVLHEEHSSINFAKAAAPLASRLKESAPDIVHIHASNGTGFFYAHIAKQSGVPVRILHSHNSTLGSGEAVKRAVDTAMKIAFGSAPTAHAACSRVAGDWLFGNEKYVVVKNSIDVQRFAFSGKDRSDVRETYGIHSDARVVGLVGSGLPVKNASYLIDLLPKLINEGLDFHLLLIGEGPESSDLLKHARRLDLCGCVHFTGTVNDPWRYYSAMDALAMPSRYEGLPITLIEAQANGLPCVVSDAVTDEADITGEISYVALKKRELWVRELFECANRGSGRTKEDPSLAVRKVRDAGFSEEGLRTQLLNLYSI